MDKVVKPTPTVEPMIEEKEANIVATQSAQVINQYQNKEQEVEKASFTQRFLKPVLGVAKFFQFLVNLL